MLQKRILSLLIVFSVIQAAPHAKFAALSPRAPPEDVELSTALYRKFLKIIPLGDSITFGYPSTDGNGYRKHLFDMLFATGNDVDMVGSVRSGNMTDNYNEGHPGWVIAQIAGAASASFNLQPNVVLLMAGTNDVNIPVEPSTAHLRLSSLIDQLNIGWPQATILVTTLIPAGKNNTQANIDAFNAQLPAIVAQRANAGERIISLT